MERLLCLLLGYVCGGFLTAELVARHCTGKSAAELGTGNPGMANLAHELGTGWGAVVLAGDIAKTALAWLLCRVLFPGLGGLAGLWSGLGAVLGHNFPAWRRFRGGKGVTVTCAALILSSPLWGTLACLIGLAVTLLSGWLPLGAVVIPALFVPPAFAFHGREAGLLALILAAYYAKQPLVSVAPYSDQPAYLAANTLAGTDRLELTVSGHEGQTIVTARFDNLGKGASGAAVQNMNLMLGFEQTRGLVL